MNRELGLKALKSLVGTCHQKEPVVILGVAHNHPEMDSRPSILKSNRTQIFADIHR